MKEFEAIYKQCNLMPNPTTYERRRKQILSPPPQEYIDDFVRKQMEDVARKEGLDLEDYIDDTESDEITKFLNVWRVLVDMDLWNLMLSGPYTVALLYDDNWESMEGEFCSIVAEGKTAKQAFLKALEKCKSFHAKNPTVPFCTVLVKCKDIDCKLRDCAKVYDDDAFKLLPDPDKLIGRASFISEYGSASEQQALFISEYEEMCTIAMRNFWMDAYRSLHCNIAMLLRKAMVEWHKKEIPSEKKCFLSDETIQQTPLTRSRNKALRTLQQSSSTRSTEALTTPPASQVSAKD